MKQDGSVCRRAGQLHEAFEQYSRIHQMHPESIECLRFLLQLCDEAGKEHLSAEFEEKLQELEKSQLNSASNLRNSPEQLSQLTKYKCTTPLTHVDKKSTDKQSTTDNWNAAAIHDSLLPL